MTPHKAKKIIKDVLDANNLPYTKLTARTVSFQDLARDSALFVTVKGWKPSPKFDLLKQAARQNGFIVTA